MKTKLPNSFHWLMLLVVGFWSRPAVAQPLTKFREVKIAAVTREAVELVAITLDLGNTEMGESYTVPGQFVQLRLKNDPKPSFFALAASPGNLKQWELLLKTGTPLADAVAAMSPRATVEVTPAQGTGFPITEHRGKDMVILAMGSGISAGRALLEFALAHRADYGAITLIEGAKSAEHFAYRNNLQAWSSAGVKIIQTVSPTPTTPWSGATGYVQEHLTVPMLTSHPTALFVVGSKEMLAGVASKLAALGLPQINPITNF